MVRFCTNCGAEIPEGAAFCTECGAKMSEPAAVPEVPAEAAAPAYQPAYPASEPMQPAKPAQSAQPAWPTPPVQYPPQASAVPTRPDVPDRSQKPVSTIAFLALKLLYAIPVIGFIASLAFAVAPENKSLKHHALAAFIWRIIILGLLIFGGIKLWNNIEPMWEQVTESVQQIAADHDIESVDDLLNSLRGG